MKLAVEDLKLEGQDLIPAVVQDARTLEVLTLAYMNEESLRRTLSERETWFWSRSRKQLWHKGETSGNTQRVVEVSADCDLDALRLLVEPRGPACHTGARSCFQHPLETTRSDAEEREPAYTGAVLEQLYALLESRKRERPEGSYTAYLFKQGLDKILKKLGEESAETIIAAKNEETGPLVAEISDLVYHLLVLMVERGVTLGEVALVLEARGQERRNEKGESDATDSGD
ncbi:MAG TPA: bifunctional phosphoribosyl-AMP cyclohydrolase/phosphoribosyl-ATP diphosphatase HisIE [Pyrinomonadaceae bacterium]|nr:bifunctional phosphoribosyl-AMP cyclohydrolase/phosphoribosyl-ATP diphosphatase HisIE [Pyrinomonadaceae bacterium]